MTRMGLIIGAALLLAPGAALAESKCDDGTLANLEQRECYLKEYKAADKELNAVYPKALAALKKMYGPGEIKNAGGQDPAADLKDAQRKWVLFRDAECRSRGTLMFGGSGQETIVAGCLASMTEERVKDLKNFLPQ